MRKWLFGVAGLLLLGIAGTEFIARDVLGLGTPPLFVADPEIEYMMAPDQDVMRFGNRQLINEYGMRSPPMDSVTQDHIVLAIGDSVLNGGSQIDHAALATTLAGDDTTFFGNASAKSWGLENMSAWIDRFGLLGAESVVLVLNSHDLTDFPTFAPLDGTSHPTKRPPLALIEGITRYLPRYLPESLTAVFSGGNDSTGETEAEAGPAEIERGRADLRHLVGQVAERDAALCVVLSQTRDEIAAGTPDPGHGEMRAVLSESDVPVVNMGPRLETAMDAGQSPFLDYIHLNRRGQQVLSTALRDCADRARLPAPVQSPS